MPYNNNADLPDRVKDHLPQHAQDIFREAFNHAFSEYNNDEERAFRVAWSAVENKYEKGIVGSGVSKGLSAIVSPLGRDTNATDTGNTNYKNQTGVLTFHQCINYGSYWQALCLVNGLNALGHNAILLNHFSRRVNMAEWKCAFRPTLPTPVPKSDYPLYRSKVLKFFRAFAGLPCSSQFPLDDPSAMPEFDQVVVGSDEVWNLRHPWYGRCPLFYGDGVRASRLVSYAASFGNYPAADGLEPAWAERLRKFDTISVRDENSRRLIQDALELDPDLVLDPCLQFPQHILTQPQDSRRVLPRPYVAVYGHNFSPSFSREVRHWAHLRGYPLVSIGYRNDWADTQWLSAGPRDFAHGIANAQAVATNFFHGCVFALNNNKPFVCETSFYRSIKVQSLMETVGGENHLVMEHTPPDVYHALLDQPLESEICTRINALRQQSEAYLKKALV